MISVNHTLIYVNHGAIYENHIMILVKKRSIDNRCSQFG